MSTVKDHYWKEEVAYNTTSQVPTVQSLDLVTAPHSHFVSDDLSRSHKSVGQGLPVVSPETFGSAFH